LERLVVPENSADKSIPSRSCDRCGSWSAVGVEYYEQYRVPEKFDRLCRDCAKEENTHTAEEMSDEELIAAIMDASIGYASSAHTEKHVRDYREGGDTAYCERAAAVFYRDLDALIESARAHWRPIQENNPEKAEQPLETVEQWKEVDEQEAPAASMGISVLYPTHSPTGGNDDE
jgi:hypothetical protein